MPKIETEEQFLDLAEKFQKDYCLLRNHVVNTQFVDLSDDLREKAHALNKEAQQIYGYISSSRQLGKYSVHDKFHRTLILSGFCLLKIAKISLNSSFFPKPIKR